jgi:uncharacterized Zn finger protein
MKRFIAENGRTTAGDIVVAACQLCDSETPVDRMVTTMHLGELLVCCRACGKGTPNHYVSRDR